MQQMARNATLEGEGWLSARNIRYLLHDRDTKFCASFRETLAARGVKSLRLPARSPNLNSYAERWVRTVKEECLSKLILFGEGSIRRALREFEVHYHGERNHQGEYAECIGAQAEPNGGIPNMRMSRGGEFPASPLPAPAFRGHPPWRPGAQRECDGEAARRAHQLV